MAYASIIEIVGIKELVEDDYDMFTKLVTRFSVSLNQVAADTIRIHDASEVSLFIFRDHCYAEANNLPVLIFFITRLRVNFFESTNYFFRSVITTGNLLIKDPQKSNSPITANGSKAEITFMEYSDVSTRLYALVERFKGIGIMVDRDMLKQSESWHFLENRIMENYYVSDLPNKKYQSFFDVNIESNDILYTKLREVFLRMHRDKLYSKKLARFYIPILINIAKNLDLRSIAESSENSFAKIIGKPLVTKNKDVPFFEFFYFVLIDKLYDKSNITIMKESGLQDEAIQLQKKIASNTWLLELLRNDSKFTDIPEELLSDSKRRKALRILCRYVTDEHSKGFENDEAF